MDIKALAEEMTELYIYIDNHFEKKMSGKPTAEQTAVIFIECSKMIMTDTIGKQRQGVPSQQKQSSDEKPTEKQIAFANKLGCDKPEGFSKKELSEWIDEHKTF